ncbi:MAG: type VII secretion protein EssC [Clostridia bacterium]|nr:type VII secretion protein EssC [Clostridia bacterium]
MFKLEKDITLTLETLNSQWFFSKNQEYDLVCQNQADESGEDSPAASDGMLRDKELWMLISKQGRRLSILVRITRFSFYPYEKYRILNPSILIGYSPRADIVYNSMKTISKEHARLEYRNQECTLYDMSKNGVYINELRVHEKQVLQFGDFINVLGCHMVYLGGYLAIDLLQSGAKVNPDKLRLESSDGMGNIPDSAQAEAEENAGTIFHRVPRNMDPIIENEIEIEPPPNEQKLKQRSLLLTIGPSMTMAIPMMLGCLLAVYASRQNGGTSSVFMYTGLVTAISAALIGSIWGIVNLRSAKKENEKEKKKRQKAYEEYLQEQERKIQLCFEQNKAVLQKMYPSALTSSTYDDKSLYLWNRNITHRDFLYERIGIGILPFQCEIKVAKPRFTVEKDPLADHPQTIKNRYSYLSEVPVGIDLKKQQLIGVIGGREKKGAFQISRILLTQIAANNCYTDVKICVVYNHKNSVEAQSMDCIKWLPHVWSADRKVRYVADNQLDMTEVFYELASVIRSRAENKSDRGDNILPYYVLVVTDPKQLEGELISKYLLHPKEEYGITTILLAERYEDLPNSCEYIIQNDTYFQGMYSVGTQKNDQESIAFDHIDEKTMETFARKLSRIEVNQLETGGEIPNVLSFFDMYGIKNIDDLQIENRWRKNRNYDSMRALIGQKSGGADCYLDIHEKYHGPHGVIAGTTGSGKSETLQTFMLSLAINFSPDDVGFFIIDYKGGGLANQFEKLPHLMGNISNLSGNQVHRAMVSIKSENRRRQRLFNENGVNNINQYTHLYKDGEIKTPIPHLLIVIDEFAELKNEEPDFMKELISVAQVGRSLGVHLILATQKPNGVVDDNIRSNAKFRLCLRVQDRQDSTDMLHKPDAAYITQAGRGYLQVGNDELYELFQSGYSGAEYENYADNGNAETAKMLSMTGKTALIGSRNKIRRKEQLRKQWIKDIVEAVEKQLCEMALTSQELKDGSAFSEKFFDAIFSFLQEKGYTFARSEHNLHKLGEFLMLYQQSMDEHVLSGEKMAVDIMERAARKGIALPEYKAKSQLDAVVEHIERLAVSAGYHEQFKLWLPVLSRKICLKELDDLYEEESVNESPDRNWKGQNGQRGLEVCVGLADDPENQAQMPVSVDFLNYGHHVICGTAGSGKSTFLQTLLYALIVKYSPEEVNLYGIDFSSHVMSAFETAPHVGGIMYENDLDKIAKFFHMIEKMVEERKQILKGGNYQQYIKTYGVKLPAIIIAIDQYAGFREKTGNSYEKNIMKLQLL